MRRKRQKFTPLERRILAVKYRDGVLVKIIQAEHNCSRDAIIAAADHHGIPRRAPRRTRNVRPAAPPLQECNDVP